jgi:two-component system chemotaxis sensor kinase CheA
LERIYNGANLTTWCKQQANTLRKNKGQMSFNTEIGPEETKVFLEEAEELLQLLDENIIKLENDRENPKIIQEIFRAAHTLKGSSAMLGHQRMTEVAHAMETLLDKLRNKKLELNSIIVDALLCGIDAIKSLTQEVVTLCDGQTDVQATVNKLVLAAEKTAQGESQSGDNHIAGQGSTADQGMALDEEAQQKLSDAAAAGLAAYRIRVSILPGSEWKAVRSMQALGALENKGTVVASQPSMAEIEQEKVGEELRVIFCTDRPAEEIRSALKSISDITEVQVTVFTARAGPAGRETAGENTGKEQAQSSAGGQGLDPRGAADQPVKLEGLQSIRVDVKVLDGLMNMVEELVIDRSRIGLVGKMLEGRYPDDGLVSDLIGTSNHIIKVVNELHQDIMKVRMVPVNLVFNKLPRLVRDLAQKQNKSLDLILLGGETELDRTIIEQISDPLIHLLRNAVDHGIESPAARKTAGKPEKAKVTLTAFQEEGHVFITLEDDGAGIDPQKIKRAAVKKSMITQETADKLTENEAINLIFAAGMSTASQVTEVSGRGVGMDIVRTNIERLNGSVSINTELGRGTTFTIKLPLTLAVFQGLMVSIKRETYIIPLSSVLETLGIEAESISSVLCEEVMNLRGEIIPLLRLDAVLGLSDHSGHQGKCYVIVVKGDNKRVGIVVDGLMDQQEFVIKPVARHIGDIKGIAGATILGDGQVALILDIPVLIKIAEKSGKTEKKVAVGAAR